MKMIAAKFKNFNFHGRVTEAEVYSLSQMIECTNDHVTFDCFKNKQELDRSYEYLIDDEDDIFKRRYDAISKEIEKLKEGDCVITLYEDNSGDNFEIMTINDDEYEKAVALLDFYNGL